MKKENDYSDVERIRDIWDECVSITRPVEVKYLSGERSPLEERLKQYMKLEKEELVGIIITLELTVDRLLNAKKE